MIRREPPPPLFIIPEEQAGMILASTFAVVIAGIFKLAEKYKQNTSYLNVKISGNVSYLLSFAVVSAAAFFIFKFNKALGIRVMQHPEEQITKTLIAWYGVGGMCMGLANGLALIDHVIYRVENLRDILRLSVFAATAYVVNVLRQPYGETESLQFILNFDYQSYNFIMLGLSVFAALFAINKKLFIGILLGSALLFSQVLHKDKVFSLDFVAFLVIFNVIQFITKKDTTTKNKQKKQEETSAVGSWFTKPELAPKDAKSNSEQPATTATNATTPSTNEAAEPKEAEATTNQTPAPAAAKTEGKTTTTTTTTEKRQTTKQQQQPLKTAQPVSIIRLIIASVFSGIGYGICGALPEQALLHIAVFTPHVTIVYLISFIVGTTLMIAILAVLEFDEVGTMNKIVLDEYKAHLEIKNAQLYLPKQGTSYA